MVNSVRQKKANKRSVLLVILVTVLLCGALSVGIIRSNKKLQDLAAERAALEANVETQVAESEALSRKESEGLTINDIIEIAREKFHLVFPNEILFVPKEK